MPLNPATEAVAATSPSPGATPLVAATDLKVVPANSERNGLRVHADTANTAVTYLRLGTAVASATDWHIALAAGAFWEGTVSGVLWRGEVHAINTAVGKLGIAEV